MSGAGTGDQTGRTAQQVERALPLARAALDLKAVDLVALDVRELVSFADTFLVATGTSDRHVRAIADAIGEAESAGGGKPLGIEGYDDARWVLIDLGDVIAHVFQGEVRSLYDLERLWSDAPDLLLGLPEQRRRDDVGPGERTTR